MVVIRIYTRARQTTDGRSAIIGLALALSAQACDLTPAAEFF